MKRRFFNLVRTAAFLTLAIVAIGLAATDQSAQTSRNRNAKPRRVAVPVPSPPATEPVVISRADDYREPSSTTAEPIPPDPSAGAAQPVDETAIRIQELGDRIKELEADQKQKRLLLNLDILSRAEQRAESLRKQNFELIEKENEVASKLGQIDSDIRPESIERTLSMTGSLRPEELREARRKKLESERKNLQTLLTEIQSTRAKLDQSLQRADNLVERLRVKLEKEIDDALIDKPDDQ